MTSPAAAPASPTHQQHLEHQNHQDLEVTNHGVRISVRDHGGDGSPLLLIHGAGRTLLDWEPMVPHLLASHRVAALDLRGHGSSDDGPWSWEGLLDDCIAVIDALSFERPALVGHSLGGMLAAMLGSSPGRCSVAVNLDGHGSIPPHEYVGIDAETVALVLAEQERQVRTFLEAMRPMTTDEELQQSQAVATTQGIAAGMPAELAVAGWTRSLAQVPEGGWITKPSPELATNLLADVAALDLFEVYRASRSPLLIFNALGSPGRSPDDPAALLARANRSGLDRLLHDLATTNPHITYEPIDATHGLIYEQPEFLAKTITHFVEAAS